jgi:hypothetical protein
MELIFHCPGFLCIASKSRETAAAAAAGTHFYDISVFFWHHGDPRLYSGKGRLTNHILSPKAQEDIFDPPPSQLSPHNFIESWSEKSNDT